MLTHSLDGIDEVLGLVDHLARSVGVDQKLAQLLVGERLGAELGGVDRGHEVVEPGVLLVVYEHHLRLVRLTVGTQPAVEGHVHGPPAEVGLGDSPTQHPFKLHAQLEGHIVDVIGIGDDDILAHLDFAGIL